jgi:hypothetical protein
MFDMKVAEDGDMYFVSLVPDSDTIESAEERSCILDQASGKEKKNGSRPQVLGSEEEYTQWKERICRKARGKEEEIIKENGDKDERGGREAKDLKVDPNMDLQREKTICNLTKTIRTKHS